MHDMPRIITYRTSSVLRLLVVYQRCGTCVCARSPSRTLRALSKAVVKLASNEDTLDESNLLKLREGRCRHAEHVRPERFRGLTRTDLRAILAMLAEESVQVPEKLMKQIMEQRVFHIIRTGGESRVADLLIVMNPSVEGELPRVADCVCLLAARVRLFQRLLFNK